MKCNIILCVFLVLGIVLGVAFSFVNNDVELIYRDNNGAETIYKLKGKEAERVKDIFSEATKGTNDGYGVRCFASERASVSIGSKKYILSEDSCNVIKKSKSDYCYQVPKEDFEYLVSLFHRNIESCSLWEWSKN